MTPNVRNRYVKSARGCRTVAFIVWGCFALGEASANGLNDVVKRVAACTDPRDVRHPQNWITRLRCDESLTVAGQYTSRKDEPECETLRVANGPGMHGIAPAACMHLSGLAVDRFPLHAPRKVLRAVAALRDRFGHEVGTAVLVANNVLLTAKHVLIANPVTAVFDFHSSDGCALADPDEELAFSLTYSDNSLYEIASSPEAKLDFSLISLDSRTPMSGGGLRVRQRRLANSCSLVDLPTAWQSAIRCRGDALWDTSCFGLTPIKFDVDAVVSPIREGAGVFVIGVTRNVFYPRGLIGSTDGSIVLYAGKESDVSFVGTTIHYNAQTARGFSGGPVLNADFQMVGMHTRGYSLLNEESALAAKRMREYLRPNGGHSLQSIFTALAEFYSHTDEPTILKKTPFMTVVNQFKEAQTKPTRP